MPIDVRVILTSRPGGGCRVSVVSSAHYGHVWRKNFECKHICLTELRTLSLLTADEVTDVHASDFNENGAMLVFQAVTEPETLIAANFEQKL